jgi:translation initiation factor 3 subunit B
MGQFIVLAGLRSMHGSLDFVDTNDFVVMNSGEHYTASDVEWDPTGRYVVTGVSYWKQKVQHLLHFIYIYFLPSVKISLKL